MSNQNTWNPSIQSETESGRYVRLDQARRVISEVPPRGWDPDTLRESQVYQTGDLIIDRHAGIVFKNGEMLMMTPTEFELMLHLIDNHTLFCSRENLIALISSRLRHSISDNTLSKHICRVRKKLGQTGDTVYVLTQNSKGYKWNMVVFKRYLSRDSYPKDETSSLG